jgi:hypothetical protein
MFVNVTFLLIINELQNSLGISFIKHAESKTKILKIANSRKSQKNLRKTDPNSTTLPYAHFVSQ